MSTLRKSRELKTFSEEMIKQTSQQSSSEAISDSALASSEKLTYRASWDEVINLLLSWLSNPEPVEYEELSPINKNTLRSTLDFCYDFAEEFPAPISVAPSVDGGVVFEWRYGDVLREIEFTDVGKAELTEMNAEKVITHCYLKRNPEHRGWLKDSIQ